MVALFHDDKLSVLQKWKDLLRELWLLVANLNASTSICLSFALYNSLYIIQGFKKAFLN